MENIYQPLMDQLQNGNAVLTAGKLHEDIPTIHDVGHAMPTSGEVRHVGYGLFMARVGDNEISFDGGGAMQHAEGENGERYSWTPLRASSEQLQAMGYDLDKVMAAVQELMQNGG